MTDQLDDTPSHKADMPWANRWFLFLPLIVGGFLFFLYYLAWSWGAGVMRDELAAWKETQQKAGYTVEHGPLEITGFPFVLRAELPDPLVADPRTGWRWQAETLFADTPPLSPNRIILSPEGEQRLTLAGDDAPSEWRVEAQTFRASLSETKTGLDIRDAILMPVEGNASGDFSRITISALIGNTLVTENPETGRAADLGRLAVSGRNVVFDYADGRPDLAIAEMDVSLVFTGVDAVLTRQPGESTVAAWQRGNGEVVIEGLRLTISDGRQAIPTQLSANGTVTLDDRAYPAGAIELTMKDHMALLGILNDQALLSREEAEQADTALKFLSQAMGEEIKAPLQMRGGKLRLGPVSIMDLDPVG